MISIILVLYCTWALLMGSASSTAYTGFNYGVRWGNQTVKTYDDFLRQFTLAQSLSSGTSGLVNSARLFTTLQPVDQEPAHDSSKPTVAIKAAIETGTYLLVGLWASALEKELVALNEALKIYGEDFTKLIIGISVGNEDLYRNSTRCLSGCYDGANNEALTSYIQGVRRNLTNGPYSKNLTGIPIGHVDTQVNWLEATKELINANDFIGVNAYPYWYNASISNSKDSFFDALQKVEGKINHKPIWITETGWPASGPTQGKAVASVENARRYWKDVGCLLFGKYNTFWFELEGDSTDGPDWGLFDNGAKHGDKARVADFSCSPGSPISSQTSSAFPTNTSTASTLGSLAQPTSSSEKSGSATSAVVSFTMTSVATTSDTPFPRTSSLVSSSEFPSITQPSSSTENALITEPASMVESTSIPSSCSCTPNYDAPCGFIWSGKRTSSVCIQFTPQLTASPISRATTSADNIQKGYSAASAAIPNTEVATSLSAGLGIVTVPVVTTMHTTMSPDNIKTTSIEGSTITPSPASDVLEKRQTVDSSNCLTDCHQLPTLAVAMIGNFESMIAPPNPFVTKCATICLDLEIIIPAIVTANLTLTAALEFTMTQTTVEVTEHRTMSMEYEPNDSNTVEATRTHTPRMRFGTLDPTTIGEVTESATVTESSDLSTQTQEHKRKTRTTTAESTLYILPTPVSGDEGNVDE